ncbi:phage tail tape measure protein, partial [Chromobacterium violaceum]
TLKDFANAGIDLKASMMNLRAQGLSPVQSMLAIITQYMQSKGPAAAGQFKQAMAIKDDKERAAALQRLSEAYKLGELFQDMQAMSFIRPAIANQEEMKDIQQGSMGAADKGFLDQDWKKRMEIAKSQIDKFKIGITELGLTIGNTLLPPISETIVEIMPAVKAFGEWAKAHPGVIKGVIGLVGGLLAGKMAFIGIKYGLNLVLSPLSALTTAITTVSSKWTLLRALIVGGGSRFSTLLQFFGMGAQRAGKLSGLLGLLGRLGGGFLSTAKRARELGSVLGGKLWGGLKLGAGLIRSLGVRLGGALLRMSSQALSLARVLSGGLLRGLMLAGRALLWLGRAAMMNPIGVAVMAIAGAAYLIYRYWTPIKAFFGQVWSAVDGVFKRYPILNYLFPIIGIPRLIMANWGRIKTFFSGLWEGVKQSMASAWSWMKMKVASWIVFWQPVFRFAGELPGKFLQAGKDLVMGLVNGIKSKIGAAKEAIVGLGADIKGWFAHTLGIKSPSRVFMGFGDNIAQGAAIGIQRSAAGAGQASGAMAQATIRGWGKPQLPMAAVTPDASHGLSARPAGSVPSGLANRVRTATQPAEATPPAAPAAKTKPEKPGYVIHFSPVIHLPAGSPEATKDAAQSAMKLSLRELEQMIRRITAQQERRAFN